MTNKPDQGWRPPASRKSCTLVTKLVIISSIFAIVPHSARSALLTNIYSKKLSELTDFASRFLIVPHETAPEAAAAAAADNISVNSAVDSSNENQLLNLGQTDSFSNNQQLQQPNNYLEPSSLELPQNDAPTTNTNANSNNNNNSPLAAAWKSLGPAKTKAPIQQQQQPNQKMQFQQIDTSKVAGEPMIQADVSTEFPNPNINNLGHEITKILKKFFVYGYDKRVRPNYSGPPALVNVSFHIIGISSVDEVQMDFTTDFYFRQKWFDPRLEFDPVGEIDELCVGAEFAEKIWLPDTFFANEKTATFHKATTENTFIRIAHNGRVYRSIRLTVTCSCPMDLQYFPMDRQRCKIEIESYGYNTRDIDYRWERGDASVSLNTKIELPQFKILGFKMGQELQNLSSGDYIRLYCEIHFVRSMGYYLIQIYIPASLIVMISWVSFWLHRNATPARVALGVTTVLTMTTLMSSTNAALPKISYIKSIDVFLGTCFVMVFASLLEYASVGYIGKRIAMKRKRLQDLQQMQQHHQKVCVAAAASAAAAAAAAHEANPILDTMTPKYDSNGSGSGFSGSGCKHKDSIVVTPLQVPFDPSGTLHRRSVTNNNTDRPVDFLPTNETGQLYGKRKDSKRSVLQSGKRISPPASGGDQQSRTPLLAAGAAIAAAAASQPRHAPTTEFEVSQTHDMIKICGLTPSAIDKHSRVVFPICFVCFNLMYWIIYGHISQQIDDKGPPLIPFIKG